MRQANVVAFFMRSAETWEISAPSPNEEELQASAVISSSHSFADYIIVQISYR